MDKKKGEREKLKERGRRDSKLNIASVLVPSLLLPSISVQFQLITAGTLHPWQR